MGISTLSAFVSQHKTAAGAPSDYSGQTIDVSLEDSTLSPASALKQYEFEKSAAKQREDIAERDAKSTAKMDAAVAAMGGARLNAPSFLARTATVVRDNPENKLPLP